MEKLEHKVMLMARKNNQSSNNAMLQRKRRIFKPYKPTQNQLAMVRDVRQHSTLHSHTQHNTTSGCHTSIVRNRLRHKNTKPLTVKACILVRKDQDTARYVDTILRNIPE